MSDNHGLKDARALTNLNRNDVVKPVAERSDRSPDFLDLAVTIKMLNGQPGHPLETKYDGKSPPRLHIAEARSGGQSPDVVVVQNQLEVISTDSKVDHKGVVLAIA